ncbi:hypothetical protein WOLCODRAFT_21735 [Wolfiporia cocos MD-104 SS10]|uniref:Uncharacterized protein n=1 Tax=Wolfiporia cocos (strain MD-104) TaxID=742152 RepID=A0A2H3ITR3_WOLCO|nr:hypothetical protein WOLCODRAFT_21735 [Wolfiporia cocos MD-104 SS10]
MNLRPFERTAKCDDCHRYGHDRIKEEHSNIVIVPPARCQSAGFITRRKPYVDSGARRVLALLSSHHAKMSPDKGDLCQH